MNINVPYIPNGRVFNFTIDIIQQNIRGQNFRRVIFRLGLGSFNTRGNSSCVWVFAIISWMAIFLVRTLDWVWLRKILEAAPDWSIPDLDVDPVLFLVVVPQGVLSGVGQPTQVTTCRNTWTNIYNNKYNNCKSYKPFVISVELLFGGTSYVV